VRLPHPDRSSAILVGTSEYESPVLPGLPSVGHNLEDFARVLTDTALGGLRSDHCSVVANPTTPRAISNALIRHGDQATDTLVVYVAGYCLASTVDNELYLALGDTDPDDLAFSALRYDALRQMLGRSGRLPAANRLLILDLQFAGEAFAAISTDHLLGRLDIDGTAILTATDRASAVPAGRNTPFTGRLVGLLGKGVVNGPELLGFATILDALRDSTAGTGLSTGEQINADAAADLALVRNRAYRPPRADPLPSGYRLAVDFGTSNTTAVVRGLDRTTRPLYFDGSPILPSAVYASVDGNLVTGQDALHLALRQPECFEPYPKQHMAEGSVLLGHREVEVVDLVAAILRRVAEESTRVAGGPPTELVLTHPEGWASARRASLVTAADRAGLPVPRLLSEPVAAAACFVREAGPVQAGKNILVYDFGAGTFDASVVRRTADGRFEVFASEGLSDVGGLDIDELIVSHAGEVVSRDAPEQWHRLRHPRDESDRRARWQLWESARRAKEQLSRLPATYLHVPVVERNIPLGREELERLAYPVINRTVSVARRALSAADVEPGMLAGVFLVGGSSRMPLVATLLHRAFTVPPHVLEQPELVVAEGAAQLAGPVLVPARANWELATSTPATAPVAARLPWRRRLRAQYAQPWGVATAIFFGSLGAATGYVSARDASRAAAVGAVTFLVVYGIRLLVAAAFTPETRGERRSTVDPDPPHEPVPPS
jgi:actin-like ATPase involved in cell morphogenesis